MKFFIKTDFFSSSFQNNTQYPRSAKAFETSNKQAALVRERLNSQFVASSISSFDSLTKHLFVHFTSENLVDQPPPRQCRDERAQFPWPENRSPLAPWTFVRSCWIVCLCRIFVYTWERITITGVQRLGKRSERSFVFREMRRPATV